MTDRPKVYTVAPGLALVDAIAWGLLRQAGGDPLALADVTLLVPTRRAVRAMQDAFLRASGGRATILPAMRAIGDVDEDAIEFAGGETAAGADLPPAISPLHRQMLLVELVRGAKPDLPPEQAAVLAAELARLIDEIETERLDRDRLAQIVPERHAAHWQETLEFLKIVTASWPKVLAEEGAVDPATRRNSLLDAQRRLWLASPPQGVVIAAGSTGTIPASADLLACVARLPRGAVVLPGLDRQMADDAWDVLDPTHPQFAMKRLLLRIGVTRADVTDWPAAEGSVPHGQRGERARLVGDAMLPAAATGTWRARARPSAAALAGVMQIDCRDHQDEAEVIALLMREALEVPGRRTALVTPDRSLARRVAAGLMRWNIGIDDSAGLALGQTPPGAFFRLVAAMAGQGFAPVVLLAALKHPLAAGGEAPGAFRATVRRFERALLRGPRPAPHLAGLIKAVRDLDATAPDAARITAWFGRLARLCRPFAALHGKDRPVSFQVLLASHVALAEQLAAASPEAGGPTRLWEGDAGAALHEFVIALDQATRHAKPILPSAWGPLIDSLLAQQVVRPKRDRHPRLAIWGPLEARLQQPDLLILGGLNEGTWPPEPGADPWMSRAMRQEFGLAPRERRIGLSAHDFAQAFCAPEVVLTRAARVEGAPTVKARWLWRLDAMLGRHGVSLSDRGNAWRATNAQSAVSAPVRPQPRPAPRPLVRLRPRALSVTEIETLIRNPYAIYARHVLKLRALDPIDADPDAAEHGSMIHGALDDFVRAFPDALPDDAAPRLIACGERAFGKALDRPLVRAFWWPRFLRIAEWFIASEIERRIRFKPLATECTGRVTIDAPAGPFTVKAKADRIDRARADGTLAILDYKTGRVPTKPEVTSGRAAQLVLEAWIAAQGGFADAGVGAAPVGELAHVVLRGGDPPGELKPIPGDVAALVAAAKAGIMALVAAYDRVDTPYHVWPEPSQIVPYDDYKDLERIAEWAGLREGEPSP